jgi:hypothetical protein
MCAHGAGYGASVEWDGSDPLRFAVLTTACRRQHGAAEACRRVERLWSRGVATVAPAHRPWRERRTTPAGRLPSWRSGTS